MYSVNFQEMFDINLQYRNTPMVKYLMNSPIVPMMYKLPIVEGETPGGFPSLQTVFMPNYGWSLQGTTHTWLVSSCSKLKLQPDMLCGIIGHPASLFPGLKLSLHITPIALLLKQSCQYSRSPPQCTAFLQYLYGFQGSHDKLQYEVGVTPSSSLSSRLVRCRGQYPTLERS